jgi:hypothetical protein
LLGSYISQEFAASVFMLGNWYFYHEYEDTVFLRNAGYLPNYTPGFYEMLPSAYQTASRHIP